MNPLNGLLLVDKPPGMTSHDVVAQTRRILGLRAVGHAGTLDPIASGLLVLLLGEGTKISDYVLNGDKGYEIKIRLGRTTTTLDRAGEPVEDRPVDVTEAQIREAAARLQGCLELSVPKHSAVKIQGKKLYEYARKDEDVEVPVREMTFHEVEVQGIELPFVTVAVRCSKGSYVRAWAARLGEVLGCGASVEELRRTHSDPYHVSDAISLGKMDEVWKNRETRDGHLLGRAWIPLKDTLPGFRMLKIEGQDEVLMKNGQISKGLQTRLLGFVASEGEVPPPVKIISQATNDLVSLLLAERGQFYKIRRVFHRA